MSPLLCSNGSGALRVVQLCALSVTGIPVAVQVLFFCCVWPRRSPKGKASALGEGHQEIAIRSSYTSQCLKNVTLVATMPDTKLYRVSARTGWPSVSLHGVTRREAHLIYNFYSSVAARALVQADPSLGCTVNVNEMLCDQETNIKFSRSPLPLHFFLSTSFLPSACSHYAIFFWFSELTTRPVECISLVSRCILTHIFSPPHPLIPTSPSSIFFLFFFFFFFEGEGVCLSRNECHHLVVPSVRG